MSDYASDRPRRRVQPWSIAGLALVAGAVAVYVLAGVVDDGMYAVAGLLGFAALGTGIKARREARRAAAPTWPAAVPVIVGGFLGLLVAAFGVAYTIADFLR